MNQSAIDQLSSILSDESYDHHSYAADKAHAMLIYGAILAHKPTDLIEFGLGTTLTTRIILAAIAYNQKGHLTVVDSWLDWQYHRPSVADEIAAMGVTIVESDQEAYLATESDHRWDFLLSDADHSYEPNATYEFRRITKLGGLIFVHDAGHETFRSNLRAFSGYRVFSANSLPHERCDRGMLMMFND